MASGRQVPNPEQALGHKPAGEVGHKDERIEGNARAATGASRGRGRGAARVVGGHFCPGRLGRFTACGTHAPYFAGTHPPCIQENIDRARWLRRTGPGWSRWPRGGRRSPRRWWPCPPKRARWDRCLRAPSEHTLQNQAWRGMRVRGQREGGRGGGAARTGGTVRPAESREAGARHVRVAIPTPRALVGALCPHQCRQG